MSGYATVEINKLNDRAAKQHLETPVVVRGNRIRSVTLTIPLSETDRKGRGSYLVVKLPKDAVDELMDRAAALPEEKRTGFIRDWIGRNQEAVLSRYFEIRDKGKKTRKFRYDVVPVPSEPAERRKAVPRKAEKPPAAKKRAEDLLIIRRDTSVKEREIKLPPGYARRQREREAEMKKRETAGVLKVSIPVSDPGLVGKELYTSDPSPILYSDPEKGDAKMNVRVRFVGVEKTPDSEETTRDRLTHKVSRYILENFTKYLSKEHSYSGRDLETAKNKLRDRVSTIASLVVSKAAGRSKTIRKFAP